MDQHEYEKTDKEILEKYIPPIELSKSHPATLPCYDCETNIPMPPKFCVPATLEENKRMSKGEFVERPPLCYACWVLRTH